jgi:hypothetical protein
MLSEQYLVTFQAPDQLPAVAQIVVDTRNVHSSSAVLLPDPGPTADAAQHSERDSAGPIQVAIAIVMVGLALGAAVVLGLIPRVRRSLPADSRALADTAGPAGSTTVQPSARVIPEETDMRHAAAPDGALPDAEPTAPATAPVQRRSPRASFTAAVQGRRSAQRDLESQPEPQIQRRPRHDRNPQPAPDDTQAQTQAPDTVFRPAPATTKTDKQATTPNGTARWTAGSKPAQPTRKRHDTGKTKPTDEP